MKNKKAVAARILRTAPGRVRFAPEALDDIRKAITRSDFRGLIAVGSIIKSRENFRSRAGARALKRQKRKGRRRGKGSHKGSKYSIISRKDQWVQRIRTQRGFLAELRGKGLLSPEQYRLLYAKCKGGFFRNKRHIKLYLKEHHLITVIKKGIAEGTKSSAEGGKEPEPAVLGKGQEAETRMPKIPSKSGVHKPREPKSSGA